MRKLIVSALTFFFVAIVAFAQNPEALHDRLDKLRAEGYDALYNLDYVTARQRFREMMALAPDHPVGAQCLAASLWLEQLNESWELKATLYSTKSYASENKRLNATRSQEFRQWVRLAKQQAKARLQKNSGDLEALYFLGAAEGLDSAFSAAVERKFMAALRSGSDSVDHHRALLKLAPEFHDAELTIGLYNYIVGSLPLPLRLVVSSMGVRGSKKRGLEVLERVSREGHWARDVARVLLVDLYKREKRWSDAILISQELAQKYPRNYLFKLQLADALTTHNSSSAEALKIFETLLAEKHFEPDVLDLIHFRYGETLLVLQKPEIALREFQFVVSRDSAEPVLKTMGRLRLAQCLDLGGKRTEALAMYRQLLGTQEGASFEDEVRRGLREPYRLEARRP